jgi:hypothetical protein
VHIHQVDHLLMGQRASRHPDYQPAPRGGRQQHPAFIRTVGCLRDEGLSTAEIGRRSKNTIIGVCSRHLK